MPTNRFISSQRAQKLEAWVKSSPLWPCSGWLGFCQVRVMNATYHVAHLDFQMRRKSAPSSYLVHKPQPRSHISIIIMWKQKLEDRRRKIKRQLFLSDAPFLDQFSGSCIWLKVEKDPLPKQSHKHVRKLGQLYWLIPFFQSFMGFS